MRPLIVGCLVVSGCIGGVGCIKANPAWDDGAAGTSTTAGPPGTSGGTTAAPTTGEAATGGTGEDATTTVATTGDSGSSSGVGSSTGVGTGTCLEWDTVPLKLAVEDTGVVQSVDPEPCPWSTKFENCLSLNFGATEFFRLINDKDEGRNAALLRFPVTSLDAAVAAAGRDPLDLLGLRLELVMWEEDSGPEEPYTLEIRGLHAANFGWTEGTKDGLLAVDGDSSDSCMTRQAGACVGWPMGRATDGADLLGVLEVDAELAADNDLDEDPGQYHAKLRSERLKGALELFGGPVAPSFAVMLKTRRDLDDEVVGVELHEAADWQGPTLLGDFCVQWDG
ncbi:MAG: hypothetical protein H0T76_22210 [Nannocystis sp.]|nr:hypothetical protein [Nannocystis sp.]MBA3549196.1 hypothetical protein [Nannocystis sp.]